MDEIRIHLEKLKASIERTRPDLLPDLDLLIKKWEEKTKEEQRVSAWHRVELARHIQRPTTLDYIQRIFDSFMELHGDRGCGDDPAIVGGIALFEGFPVTVIGHQKGRNMKENLMRNYGMAHPEGYRKALRLAKQAEKFSRPVITFIDTSGAYPGMTAEERGIGEAIARNLKEFSVLEVPVVCVVIGEGGSGGALGIGVGDEIYMLENAIYSVISPEGCASILLRDASKAKEAAELMKLTAQDLLAFGIIDGIVPEPPGGAHIDPDFTAGEIKKTIRDALKRLRQKKPGQLVKERSQKYFSIGVFEEGGEEGSSLLRRLFGQQTGA